MAAETAAVKAVVKKATAAKAAAAKTGGGVKAALATGAKFAVPYVLAPACGVALVALGVMVTRDLWKSKKVCDAATA